MIHEDIAPFLVLTVVAIVSGIAGKKKGKNSGFIFFSLGGFLPLIAYISNAERLPVPNTLEMCGVFSAIPLFLAGSYLSERKGNIFFWMSTAIAIIIAALINLMIVGRLRIPL